MNLKWKEWEVKIKQFDGTLNAWFYHDQAKYVCACLCIFLVSKLTETYRICHYYATVWEHELFTWHWIHNEKNSLGFCDLE